MISPNNRMKIFIISSLLLFLPLTTFAEARFADFSTDSVYLPVMIVFGLIISLITFFYPKIGLYIMLLTIMIATDTQVGDTEQTVRKGVSLRLEDILLVFVSGGWLINRAKTRTLTKLKNVPLNRPIFIMIGAIVIATVIGYIQGTVPARSGFLYSMKRIEYFWIFFMTLNMMETYEDGKKCIKILFFSAILISIYGSGQLILAPASKAIAGGLTATAGIGRANTFGSFLLIIIGLSIGMYLYAQTKKDKVFYAISFFLSTGSLIMSTSRGAYASIPILVLAIYLISLQKRLLHIAMYCFLISISFYFGKTVIAHSTAGDLVAFHEDIITRQMESLIEVAKEGPSADSSLQARIDGWRRYSGNILKYPLFGTGVGSIPLGYIDNQYVRETLETGILGLLAFLYMNFIILKTTIYLFRKTHDPYLKGLTVGFAGGHCGILIHALTISNFYTILSMEAFFFITAIIMLFYHNTILQEQEEKTPAPNNV